MSAEKITKGINTFISIQCGYFVHVKDISVSHELFLDKVGTRLNGGFVKCYQEWDLFNSVCFINIIDTGNK